MAGRRIQYQQIARPVTLVAAAVVACSVASTPVVYPRSFIYQAKVDPIQPGAPAQIPQVVPATVSTEVIYPRSFIYQAKAEPVVPPAAAEVITPDKWLYAWSESVRSKQLAVASQQQPVLSLPVPAVVSVTIAEAISPDVIFTKGIIYQTKADPVLPGPLAEIITPDKWAYAWPEPVRTRQLAIAQQQSIAVTTVFPEVITESKWHYPWSDPVRSRQLVTAHQQPFAFQLNDETQIIQGYESRWHYLWSEPVRQKAGLGAYLQSSFIDPTYAWKITGEVITADKWAYSWSEPVRTRQLATAHQQSFAFQLNDETQIIQGYESRWHYAWSEPVRTRQLATAHQQPFAFQLNDETQIIQGYESRWHYPWSEPVRQKPGLATQLQQFFADPTYGWALALVFDPSKSLVDRSLSEPVRTRQLAAAHQQQPVLVLNDETQIIQGYESRWHYPWSEPTRTRQLATAHQQQPIAIPRLPAVPPFDPSKSLIENVEGAVWFYKTIVHPFIVDPRIAGLPSPPFDPSKSSIQFVQGDTGVTFQTVFTYQISVEPEVTPSVPPITAVTPSVISAAVIFPRSFIYQTHTEPLFLQPAVPTAMVVPVVDISDVIFPRSFIYQAHAEPVQKPTIIAAPLLPITAWSEPVRTRQLPVAHQQQPVLVLNDETQIIQNYESRWHYPWSEPVRVKQFSAAHRQAIIPRFGPIGPPTAIATEGSFSTPIYRQTVIYQSVAEPIVPAAAVVIPPHEWFAPLTVRPTDVSRRDHTTFVLEPETQITPTYESRWHYAWSEPVRTRQLAVAHQQQPVLPPVVPVVAAPIQTFLPWSEPVRTRLLATAQRPALAALVTVPIPANIAIAYPWSEPVRTRQLATAQQQLPAFVFAFDVSKAIVHQGWSEPVRVRQLAVAHQQAMIPPHAPVHSPTAIATEGLFSGPIYRQTVVYQSAAEPIVPPPAVVAPPSFNLVLGDTGVVFQTWFAYQTSVDVQGLEIHNWWLQPFSEPVRQKPGLAVHLQQQPTLWPLPILPPPPTAVTPSAVSTEVIFPRSFIYQARVDSLVVKETITADKWIYAWSEPVRTKRFAVAYQPSFTLVLEPNTEITPRFESRWHQPWSEPVRVRQLATAQYQALIPRFAPIGPPAPIATEGYFSGPIYRLTVTYQSAAEPILPITSLPQIIPDKFFPAWPDPVRTRQLATAQQQQPALVLNPDLITGKYESRWHYAWSEPVRQKPGLRQDLQVAFVPKTPPSPNFLRIIPWLQAYAEPVRKKPGLGAWLQGYYVKPPEKPSGAIDITVTLLATEINNDTALMLVNVSGAPVYCSVAVKELKLIYTGAVSIEELPVQSQAAVSIKED